MLSHERRIQALIPEERRIIAANVRRLRGMALSASTLAKRAGVDIRTVRNIEKPVAGRETALPGLIRVAHALGTTIIALRGKGVGE